MPSQSKSARAPGDQYQHLRGYLSLVILVAAVSVAVVRSEAADTLVLVSPGTAHAGSAIKLPIILETSSRNLSALEWQISMPQDVEFEATSSLEGKWVQCYKLHCILYGGQRPLVSGVIATLRVRLPGPAAADIAITLHDVLGSTSDAAPRKIGNASLMLRIEP